MLSADDLAEGALLGWVWWLASATFLFFAAVIVGRKQKVTVNRSTGGAGGSGRPLVSVVGGIRASDPATVQLAVEAAHQRPRCLPRHSFSPLLSVLWIARRGPLPAFR